MAQELEDELLALAEIYGNDFQRQSTTECTVALASPWERLALRFVLSGNCLMTLNFNIP